MIIGSRHGLKKIELNPEIKIGGQSVKRVKTTKCLGMIIDDKLRWEGHVDHVSKNVSWGIGAMKSNHMSLKIVSIRSIMKPYFDHCSLVWRNCKLEKQIKLQKLQNRAARVITGDNWEIRSKGELFETLMFMRKILKVLMQRIF